MWICPGCQAERIESRTCPKCQYSQSDNFEKFPMLIPLPGTVQTLSKRHTQWFAVAQESTLACEPLWQRIQKHDR